MKTLLSICLALFALSTSAADLPKYWAVHIDSVAKHAEYEKLHRQEDEIKRDVLVAHNVPRPATWKLETSAGTYISFRGRASLADFEKPSSIPADVRKEMNEKLAPLEQPIHSTLRNHHDEIWELDRDTTFLPSVAAPKYARLITEQVKTTRWDAYNEVLKRVHAAFEKHGVALVAFYSSYGDGACRYVLMSDKPIDVRAIAGDDVLREWKACVIRSTNLEVHARPDLTATDPAVWIQ